VQDYWSHGGGVSWGDARAIAMRFGFGFDAASNAAGSRFDNRRMSVLIAPNDRRGELVNRIMLAEEIQHGLDKPTKEAGRFARENPDLAGDALVAAFHVAVFKRMLKNAADGLFDFLTVDDIAGIEVMLQELDS
jgi:hypothetical protein